MYINYVHLIQDIVKCHNIFVDILFGRSIHSSQLGVEIPYYHCVAVNIFLEVLQDFPCIFRYSHVGHIYVYESYVFLMD